jgi:O-phosphoseryl-tRNA(Cys) synthetase
MEVVVFSKELGKWMEIGGSGIFRPEVCAPWGIKEPVRVLAWGQGLERIAMLRLKRNDIRDDALYYTALTRSEMFRKNPTAENRGQAQNAWNIVKRMYGSTPEHSRFKTANEQLSAIK